jgi:Tfp pilus assembly ATPase PilU
MQTMDRSIAEMYSHGYLDKDDAIIRSNNPGKMEKTIAMIKDKGEISELVETGTNFK